MRLTQLPLIKPAIRLMNRLPFVRKFILVSVFFVFPLIILGGALFLEINHNISVSKQEQKGVALLPEAYELLFLAHDYRDSRMMQRAKSEQYIDDQVKAVTQKIDTLMASFKSKVEAQGIEGITSKFSKLNTIWNAMKGQSAGAQGGPNIQFQFYNSIVKHFEHFLKSIAYESQLIHDSSMDIFLLVNTLMQYVPTTLESMGYARGYGTYALNLDRIDYETFNTFDKIYDDLNNNEVIMRQNMTFTLNVVRLERVEKTFKQIETNTKLASEYFYTHLIEKDFITEDPENYFKVLSAHFAGIQSDVNSLIPIIKSKITKRIQREELKLWGTIFSSFLLIIIIFYLYAGMYISIALVSINFTKKAKKVASGDLSVTLDVRSNDELSQLYIAFNDMVKQLKQNHEKLVQADKMASLGGMIAGVAHEMNTPLGIGITAITKLKEDLDWIDNKYKTDAMKRSDLETYLEHGHEGLSLVQANMQRCSKLINSFKQLSIHKSTESPHSIDIMPIILNVVSPSGILNIPPSVRIDLDADSELMANVDPDLLSLVLVNIISNILQHAFPNQEGEIKVIVKKHESTLSLEISDNGEGISDQDIAQIFEPFYTTRRNQGYVGLGLHIVYVILTQALNGSISVESIPQQGTTFKIEIAEFNPFGVQQDD